jgi:hypothetical protein
MDEKHVASVDDLLYERQLDQLVRDLEELEQRAFEIEIRVANLMRWVDRVMEECARRT